MPTLETRGQSGHLRDNAIVDLTTHRDSNGHQKQQRRKVRYNEHGALGSVVTDLRGSGGQHELNGRRGIVIAVVLFVAVVTALIVYSSLGLAQFTGEVCVTHNGQTVCRVASGSTEAEVIATGLDMACAMLPTANMADRVDCTTSQPTTVSWR